MKTYDERSRDIRTKLEKKRKQRSVTTTILSLTCCLLLVAGIWAIPRLSAPVSPTGDYRELVTHLQTLMAPATNGTPKPEIPDGGIVEDVLAGVATPDEAPPMGMPESDNLSPEYGQTTTEITDSQVAGVKEADIIKRTDRHIFYLRGGELSVYSIEKEASRLLGTYDIRSEARERLRIYTHETQMYLSQDGTRVIILTDCYDDVINERYLYCLSLDVTDPEKIMRSGELCLTGAHNTSRLIGDRLYVLSTMYVDYYADWDDPSTFLPGYGQSGDMTYLPEARISIPEKPTTAMYTVVTAVDTKDLSVEDSIAALSYHGPVYMSRDNIYLTRPLRQDTETDAGTLSQTFTQICRISFKNGLKIEGEASVCGILKDQYSMDEYDGMLRVVTTERSSGLTAKEDIDGVAVDDSVVTYQAIPANANLYCIDLRDHSIRSSVIRFAPDGETVQSVRFDRDKAYVCTSLVLQDPVFFFDLSDPDHITFKDTGTIDGYSMSLVDFADGFLMGIGYGDDFSTLKIEMYREGQTAVESHCVYELENCSFSSDYKSYYIDRQQQLIGLGVDDCVRGTRYILLHFDGYELIERLDLPLSGNPAGMRAVVIDGYAYMLGEGFLVAKLS